MNTVAARPGTELRFVATFGGKERHKTFYASSIVVGRASNEGKPDFDLSPDQNVSRRHARIWIEESECWVEDLGSKFGTKVNGTSLAAGGKLSLNQGSLIQLGDTLLRFDGAVNGELAADTQAGADPGLEIGQSIDADEKPVELALNSDSEAKRRQALLDELPVQFSAATRGNEVLQNIISCAVQIIPGAKRGTLLLCKANSDSLLLGAFVSQGGPAFSQSLAQRALKEGKGFIWRRGLEGDPGVSVRRLAIESGMYAPLLRHGKPQGVLCVDNPFRDTAFSDDDLRWFLAISQQAATAVANYHFLMKFGCQSVRVLPE